MVNILILMAGKGSRFQQVGYTFPKPLIEVNSKPMIEVVVNNLKINGKYIFLVLKEHYEKYALNYLLPLITRPNKCEIVVVDTVTEGAACTALLARDLINNDDELITANSDQWIDWNPDHFLNFVRNKDADGAITTFIATHSRWSFAKVEETTNLITEVAEKKPISNIATTGIYYFKKGKDFVGAAEQMINKNIRVNNEFYLCPVYNELILNNKKIYNYPVAEMWGLGTPEDLNYYLNNFK